MILVMQMVTRQIIIFSLKESSPCSVVYGQEKQYNNIAESDVITKIDVMGANSVIT
jgi:hypothetical protein